MSPPKHFSRWQERHEANPWRPASLGFRELANCFVIRSTELGEKTVGDDVRCSSLGSFKGQRVSSPRPEEADLAALPTPTEQPYL